MSTASLAVGVCKRVSSTRAPFSVSPLSNVFIGYAAHAMGNAGAGFQRGPYGLSLRARYYEANTPPSRP